jgi:membrane protease YdiL (CAAX protease family)
MQTSSILIYSFCYAMIFIISMIGKKEGSQRLIKDDGTISDKPGNIIGLHIIGILLLGVVPALVLNQPVLKTITGSGISDSSLFIILLVLLILTAALAIKTGKKNQQQFADSKHNHYQMPVLFIFHYFIIRSAFLFIYELFFRGFLLFDSISRIGMPAAVALNVFLYVLLHIFNSKKEMIACIPFGLLVCFLSIVFNAVWPAIVLHIGFSLVYELTIYRSYLYTFKTERL